MKKKLLLSIFTAILLTLSFSVKAESTCSIERGMELSSLANNVNADYAPYEVVISSKDDPILSEGEFSKRTAFYVRVYNLTNDLNVRVSLDGYKDVVLYNKDARDDGVVYLDSSYPDKIKTYTLTIRSNDGNCRNEVLRKIEVTVPALNYFHNYQKCVENPDFYMCQEYTTTDFSDVDESQFQQQIDEYIKNKQEEEAKQNKITYKVKEFVKKYVVFFIIIIALLVIAIVIEIIKGKQRRKLI